nr:MAG TPA: hypothetical protein [Caudoviricetes sp.]
MSLNLFDVNIVCCLHNRMYLICYSNYILIF